MYLILYDLLFTVIFSTLLLQLGKSKGNEKIAVWTDHIINHFWYSSSNCEGQESKLKVRIF